MFGQLLEWMPPLWIIYTADAAATQNTKNHKNNNINKINQNKLKFKFEQKEIIQKEILFDEYTHDCNGECAICLSIP